MHENAPLLEATKRERIGSRYARRARENGQLPAVVYGHGEAPDSIAVDSKEALSHIHKGEKVFKLTLDGKEQVVLLTDVQFGYLGDNIVHCDFARVDLTERVETSVHIELIGQAKGLKQANTVLMHPTTELELECQVVNLPDVIEVDVSNLEAGESIHASDITLPGAEMKLLTDPDAIVAQINFVKEEEESAEGAEVEAKAQPEVIGEKDDKDEKGDE